jgi:carbon storage regulator
MLVLSRRQGEKITIGDDIVITILRTGKLTRVGIEAPKDVKIRRAELPLLNIKDGDQSEP